MQAPPRWTEIESDPEWQQMPLDEKREFFGRWNNYAREYAKSEGLLDDAEFRAEFDALTNDVLSTLTDEGMVSGAVASTPGLMDELAQEWEAIEGSDEYQNKTPMFKTKAFNEFEKKARERLEKTGMFDDPVFRQAYGEGIKAKLRDINYNSSGELVPVINDSTFDYLASAAKRGWLSAEVAKEFQKEIPDVEKIARLQAEIETLPASQEYATTWNDNVSREESWNAFKKNPVRALGEMIAESFGAQTNMQIANIGKVGERAAQGLGAGMIAGIPAGPPGMIIAGTAGLATGATWGLAELNQISSQANEYASEIISSLQESGVDVTNKEQLEAALNDAEKMAEIRERAERKSIPVGLFDGVATIIGGKIFTKPARKILGKIGQWAGELAVQSAMGGGGETVSQLYAEGEITSPRSILAEIIAEPVTSVGEVAIGQTARGIVNTPKLLSPSANPQVNITEAELLGKSEAMSTPEGIVESEQVSDDTRRQQMEEELSELRRLRDAEEEGSEMRSALDAEIRKLEREIAGDFSQQEEMAEGGSEEATTEQATTNEQARDRAAKEEATTEQTVTEPETPLEAAETEIETQVSTEEQAPSGEIIVEQVSEEVPNVNIQVPIGRTISDAIRDKDTFTYEGMRGALGVEDGEVVFRPFGTQDKYIVPVNETQTLDEIEGIQWNRKGQTRKKPIQQISEVTDIIEAQPEITQEEVTSHSDDVEIPQVLEELEKAPSVNFLADLFDTGESIISKRGKRRKKVSEMPEYYQQGSPEIISQAKRNIDRALSIIDNLPISEEQKEQLAQPWLELDQDIYEYENNPNYKKRFQGREVRPIEQTREVERTQEETPVQTEGEITENAIQEPIAESEVLGDEGIRREGELSRVGEEDAKEVPSQESVQEEVVIEEGVPKSGVGSIYKRIRNGNEVWMVQQGEERGVGDTIHETEESALEESRLTVARTADKIQRQSKLEEQLRRESEERKERENLDGFEKNLSPMKRGLVVKQLSRQLNYKGSPISRRDLIRRLVSEGRKIGVHEGQRVLENTNGDFLGENVLTKAGLDYAEFLIDNNLYTPSSQEEVVARDTTQTSEETEVSRPSILRGEGGYVTLPSYQELIDFGRSIYRKGMEFADWSVRMIRKFGEEIKRYLNAIWDTITSGAGTFVGMGREAGSVNVGRTIRKTTGVSKEITKVSVSEMAALKSQIRMEARAVREARKQQSQLGKELSEKISELELKGKLTPAQAKSILKRGVKVNFANPKSVTRFLEYMDKVAANANYAKSLADAKVLQKRANIYRKRKNIADNYRETLNEIRLIDTNMVDDIEAFNARVGEFMKTFRTITGPERVRGSVKEMSTYLEELRKQTADNKAKLEAESLDESERDGVSADALKEILESENPEAELAQLADERRRKIEAAILNQAKYSQQEIRQYTNPEITEKEREILKAMQNIDVERLSVEQQRDFIRASDNIVVNDAFYGTLPMVSMFRALEAVPQALRLSNSIKLGKVIGWTKMVGADDPANLIASIFDRQEGMAKISRIMGWGRFIMGVTRSHKTNNKIADESAKFYREVTNRNDEVNTYENRVQEGFVAIALQYHPGMDDAESLQVNKDLIRENIEVLRESTRRSDQQEAEAINEVFTKVIEPATSKEDLIARYKKFAPDNMEVLNFLIRITSEHKPFLEEHHQLFYNDSYEWNNKYYLPISFRPRKMGELIENEDLFRSVDLVQPKQAPNSIRRKYYKKLPKGKVFDWDVRRAVSRSLNELIFKANTDEHYEQIRQFLALPEARQIFGGDENLEAIKKMVKGVYDSINRTPVTMDDVGKILDVGVNKLRRFATIRKLGGVTQFPKQISDQLTNAIANLGMDAWRIGPALLDINAASPLLDKFSISERGAIKGGTRYDNQIEQAESKIQRYIQKKQYSQAAEILDGISNIWMKALTAGDVGAARVSWIALYEKYLSEHGVRRGTWQEEADAVDSDPVRMDAALYAEMTVDRIMVPSDPTRMSPLAQRGKSGWENVVKAIFLPFSSPTIQQKRRLIQDIWDIRNGRDLKNATKSLVGTVAGIVVFNMVRIAIGYGIIEGAKQIVRMFGVEPGEEDEEQKLANARFNLKKFYSQVLVDLTVGGAPNFFEDTLIDSLNWSYYTYAAILGSDDVKKKNGELMKFGEWKKDVQKTPLYRYGQWESGGAGMGLLDVAWEGPEKAIERINTLMDMKADKYNDQEKNLIMFSTAADILYWSPWIGMDADVYRMIQRAERSVVKSKKDKKKEKNVLIKP